MTLEGQRKRSKARHAFWAVPLLIVVAFVLDCSGILFPVIGAQSSFENGMSRDLGMAVPASLKVLHAARCATRDPAYFYECDIAAADFAGFRAGVEAAAIKKGHKIGVDNDTRITLGESPPAWYVPEKHPDNEKFTFSVDTENSHEAYWFFFCAADHKIYVYWFST